MESSNQFDVEKEIISWRSELGGSLATQELDELENHLRESMDELASEKLTAEEAFTLAKRRLGNPVDLRNEYQKTNPSRLWSIRVCWMLVGYLSFTLIDITAALFSKLTVLISYSSGLQSGLANLSGILILIGTWTLFCRFLQNRCQSNERSQPIPFSEFLRRHPIASALTIATLYPITQFIDQSVAVYFTRVLAGAPGQAIHDYLLTQLFSHLGLTCLLLAGATLAIHRLRSQSS